MPQTNDTSFPPHVPTNNVDRAVASLRAALTEADDKHSHLVEDLNAVLLNYDRRLSALTQTVEPLTRQSDQLRMTLRFFQDKNHETVAALTSFETAIGTLYDSIHRIEVLATACRDCRCRDNVRGPHFVF